EVISRSQGNSIEIVNGEMSVTKSFEYTLSPKKIGTFKLGPVTTYIEGKELKAGPIQIKVVDNSAQTQVNPPPVLSQPIPTPMPNPPWSSPPRTAPNPSQGNPDTFLKASVDKTSAYVGEEVIFTLRLYSAVSLREASYKAPELGEFIREELHNERRYETQLDGRKYLVVEWKSALYPLKAGTLKTGQIRVSANAPVARPSNNPFNSPFFNFPGPTQWEDQEWVSDNINIQVKALPPAPPNFIGLVGENFSLEGEFKGENLKVGDSAELRLTIEGKGNLSAAKLPDWEIEGFKSYPSTPQLNVKKSPRGLGGTKVFDYALVAQKEGDFNLKVPEFFYFNTKTESYESLERPSWAFKVGEGNKDEALVSAGLENNGALPPPEEIFDRLQGDVLKEDSLFKKNNLLAWGLAALGPLLYFFFILIRLLKKRASLSEKDKRRSQAFRNLKSRLKELKEGQEEDLSLAIKNYFSDRFKIKAEAMTAQELSSFLREKGLAKEELETLETSLKNIEYMQYAPGLVKEDWKSLMTKILPLMRQIEKKID
ncbi:MAG: BatD family protein, partial [Deltaproteobacteria bacterium]|nr:BatD family protein [Deltaproteobacteria bacterium]